MRRPKADSRSKAAEADERAVRTAALALLAGRDFGRHELAERLLRKGYPSGLIAVVLDGLMSERLLSDDRYAGQFVGQRAARGKGPVRIRMELRHRGVESATVDDSVAAAEVDWIESARALRRRRFGEGPPADARERAKQARFLQYRGFTAEQIRAALGTGDADDES